MSNTDSKQNKVGYPAAVTTGFSSSERRFALTPGEPAGIGPDLVLMMDPIYRSRMVVIADPAILEQRAAELGLDVEIATTEEPPRSHTDAALLVSPIEVAVPVVAGQLNPLNAAYVLKTLNRAAEGCLSGEFSALVTGPVHKGVINDAGVAFRGHTELLAELAGSDLPVMMLSTPGLRVALVTTHLPLRQVSDAITEQLVERTIRILVTDLHRKFGIANARVVVCGLNPHAGEGGHLGTEEQTIIQPVVERLKQQGFRLTGPTPADTAFIRERLQNVDAVLAMYHDQGLPVLKHAGFGEAVNITLGLPFIRTSVDHGTALDLAASGQIDVGSLHAAIVTAIDMIESSSGGQSTTP